jgi:hypothetical protein
MMERISTPSPGRQVTVDLQAYVAEIQFSSLTLGVDNLRYDVCLSPRFVEFTQKYVADLVRQMARLEGFFGVSCGAGQPGAVSRTPEAAAFRRLLTEMLQASLVRAQALKQVAVDLLARVALLKFLTSEIASQFSNLMLECKQLIQSRGELFERSEKAQVMKSRLAEVQADRRNVLRQVGQQVYQALCEVEDTVAAKLRKALFGDDFTQSYGMLRDRLLFVEGGKDDYLFLEHYVLLGSFVRDPDRFETVEGVVQDFLADHVLAGEQGEAVRKAYRAYDQLADQGLAVGAELARLEEERENLVRQLEGGGDLFSRLGKKKDPAQLRAALADVQKRHAYLQQKLEGMEPQVEEAKRKADGLTEEYQQRLGDFLNQPENARRLFDPNWDSGGAGASREAREALLEEWVQYLTQRGLLAHVLASYELRKIYQDYCPPVHLQQLKKALVNREELKRVEDILKQFPTRRFSPRRIEESARAIQRMSAAETRALAMKFAEDFMRLRRDLRNYKQITGLMERINLVGDDRSRELSRMNNSLYECVLPDEEQPAEDRVLSHVIIKADVRGSTQITQDLLARGMNPASYFSLNLHEPVKRMLERYGAAKVFIEGDAIILAIYETVANRAHLRVVARACVLARQIIAVCQAYNARVPASDLPPLELGVGVAFQSSPPAYWMDGETRIMISRAVNLSDRLSSCSRAARRLLKTNPSPFSLFLFQTISELENPEEAEEFTIRYNMNGVELNEEGFQKLSNEVALTELQGECEMPWGKDQVTLFCGDILVGDAFERIVVRRGIIRELRSGNLIGHSAKNAYYEVCTTPQAISLADRLLATARRKG